jgi:hypothetical protein
MKDAVCSDLHHGPLDHPANDETPGWREEYMRRVGMGQRVWCAGDMNELLQFSEVEIGSLVHTDVEGNHDREMGPRELEIYGVRGLTLLLHGHQFDPWYCWLFGRPAALVARVLECCGWDVDKTDFVRAHLHLGRHGAAERYARKAAEYAAKHGAWQIVFGHLHQRFERDVLVWSGGHSQWVHVICTGCCCNGRLDFVEIEL